MLPDAEVLLKSATVDLDFQRSAYRNGNSQGTVLADFVTTSRASEAYADDTAGNWILFGNNVPRRTDKGLLVEEARTNSIRNNSMQGAVAGSPGTRPTNWPAFTLLGLTQTIATPAPELGVDVLDVRFNGTTTAGGTVVIHLEAATAIAAVAGQTWTGSAFVKIQAGTTTNITGWSLRIQELDAGGANVFQDNIAIPTPTGSLTRFSGSRTLTGGATAFVRLSLVLTVANGVAVDITVRVGWPQLELGDFASSPIRTTTVAATRAADVVPMTTLPTFEASISAVGAGTPIGPETTTNNRIMLHIGSSASDRLMLARNPTGVANAVVTSSSVNSLNALLTSWAQNAAGTLALGAAANDFAAAFNGGAVATDLTGPMPAGSLTNVRIGCLSSGINQWNGYITRVAVWPTTRLHDTDLQMLTGGATGAITEAQFVLDSTPLSVALYALDSVVVSPSTISAGNILVELDAYTLPTGPIRTLYFGSDGYNDPTAPGFYEPRMTQPFSFRRDIFGGNTTGGPNRVSFGEMRLANSDGELDDARTLYAFAGWPARLLIGDINQPYSTWETLIIGKPQQAMFSYNDLAISLLDRLQDFAQPMQINKYRGDNVLPLGLEGLTDIKDRPKPLLYGVVQNISPVLVNTAKLIYQVNDGPIEEIGAVYDKAILLPRDWNYTDETDMMNNEPLPGYYRVWPEGGYFRLGAAPSGAITCDARDRILNSDCTAAQVALRIARRPAEDGEPPILDADINWSDVAQLDRLNTAVTGIWLPDETQFGSALQAILGSIGAWYGFDRLGFFRMQRLDLPLGPGVVTFRRFGPDSTGAAAVGEFDVINVRFLPTNDPDRGIPTYEVSLEYGRNYTVQSADALTGNVGAERKNFVGLEYRTALATDPTLKDPYPLALQKKVQTQLLYQWDAVSEAQRLLVLYSDQRDFIEIDTPMLSDLIPMIDIGSEVKLVLPRFNYTTGRVLRVIGIQYNALGRIMTLGLWG